MTDQKNGNIILKRLRLAEFCYNYFQKLKIETEARYFLLFKLLKLKADELELELRPETCLGGMACGSGSKQLASRSQALLDEFILAASQELSRRSINGGGVIDLENYDVWFWATKSYPERALNCHRPVLFIWHKGQGTELAHQQRMAAVVGSRTASAYGLKVARDLANVFARKRVCLVSGMARGIDSASQREILRLGGMSVGVMAGGLNYPYPQSSLDLYAELVKQGLILAIFPPDSRPQRWHFPERNQLIAALSDEIFIIEAKRRSGSLITAQAGLDAGRNVWSVPGPIYKASAYGCNSLLDDGARPMYDLNLVEEYYSSCDQIKLTSNYPTNGLDQNQASRPLLSQRLRQVLLTLEEEDLSFTQLASSLKLDSISLRKELGRAMADGLIINSGGKYILTLGGISSIYS